MTVGCQYSNIILLYKSKFVVLYVLMQKEKKPSEEQSCDLDFTFPTFGPSTTLHFGPLGSYIYASLNLINTNSIASLTFRCCHFS